jgi:hypothetical protein
MSTENSWGVQRMMPEAEPQVCEECGHAISLHEARYGCDYEADEWVWGVNCDGLVAVRCGCTAWTVEPERAVKDEFQALLERTWNALREEPQPNVQQTPEQTGEIVSPG